MLRERFIHKGERHFTWRGTEVTRIEGLSDAVFAFAVTLLVVSLEVPDTFDELLHVMSGFGAFAISFSLLFMIWYNHFLFFRRYGLQDRITMALNAMLLFVILFYIYPLKFLFSLVVGEIFFGYTPATAGITGAQLPLLMTIYASGFLSVFAIFFFLHLHAWRLRENLELTDAERYKTRMELAGSLIFIGVSLLSIVIALVGGPTKAAWAGWCYGLIGPLKWVQRSIESRKLRRLIPGK
jgi:uncharacterized membrane protein